MIIGFTGTRSGMSENQVKEITEFLRQHEQTTTALHGVCIGADADFHHIIRTLSSDIFIIGYPGKGKYDKPGSRPNRAKVIPDKMEEEDTHFARNRRIVEECDILLACPYNMNGQGGTWYTINYAKKIDKPCKIFLR